MRKVVNTFNKFPALQEETNQILDTVNWLFVKNILVSFILYKDEESEKKSSSFTSFNFSIFTST